MIKIVTDSTCDLPAEWVQRYNITIIPVNIQFGLDTFQENVTLSPAEFYRRIAQSHTLPTTSQPAVGEIAQIYQSLAQDGSQIISLHLTSKLSGTWQAAALAAQQLPNSRSIAVIDSFTGSVGLGFMVREAAQLAQAGLSLPEIVQRLEARREQIKIYLMLKDLHFARMSGRVGRVREMLASLLRVKPIISVDNGELALAERARGQRRGFERMVSLAAQALGAAPVHLAVAHAQDRLAAERLLAQAQAQFNYRDAFISELALSIAVHFGPGAVGFVAYPAE